MNLIERRSSVEVGKFFKTQISINLKKNKQGLRLRSCVIEVAFLESIMGNNASVEPYPVMLDNKVLIFDRLYQYLVIIVQ